MRVAVPVLLILVFGIIVYDVGRHNGLQVRTVHVIRPRTVTRYVTTLRTVTHYTVRTRTIARPASGLVQLKTYDLGAGRYHWVTLTPAACTISSPGYLGEAACSWLNSTRVAP